MRASPQLISLYQYHQCPINLRTTLSALKSHGVKVEIIAKKAKILCKVGNFFIISVLCVSKCNTRRLKKRIDVVPSWQDHRCNVLKNDIQIISFDGSIVGRQTGGQISIADRSLWLMITSATRKSEYLVRGTHIYPIVGHNGLPTRHRW